VGATGADMALPTVRKAPGLMMSPARGGDSPLIFSGHCPHSGRGSCFPIRMPMAISAAGAPIGA